MMECFVISIQRWVLPSLKRLLGNDGGSCHALAPGPWREWTMIEYVGIAGGT